MAYISFQPTDFFKALKYSYASPPNAISGVGFSADFTWNKARSNTENNNLWDTPRTAGYGLRSDATTAEFSTAQGLKSWQSDGFTMGTNGSVNGSAATFASYNWKGGTTTGIDTTGSTITPSAYSFSATAGISIVKYTGNATSGAKLAHGLGAIPGMVMVKRLDVSSTWAVYHEAMGNTKNMKLNTTAAATVSSGFWNDTTPDSVNFTLGNNTDVNNSGTAHVAYCFAEKKGFSKNGWYEGNGNADGPFIYTGFRPAYVLIKKFYDAAENWFVFDDKRLGYNPDNDYQNPNLAGADGTGNKINILSNGFKCIDTAADINQNGTHLLFMAFAEFPFVSSNSIPTVAR